MGVFGTEPSPPVPWPLNFYWHLVVIDYNWVALFELAWLTDCGTHVQKHLSPQMVDGKFLVK